MMFKLNTKPNPPHSVYGNSGLRDPQLRRLYVEFSAAEVPAVAKAIEAHCVETAQSFVDIQIENWGHSLWDAVNMKLPHQFRMVTHFDADEKMCGRSIVYKAGQ